MAAQRNFPRKTLDQALRVARIIKEKNGGNPWPSVQVADALGLGRRGGNFYYITAASRDYGLTEGTRETAEIKLTDRGPVMIEIAARPAGGEVRRERASRDREVARVVDSPATGIAAHAGGGIIVLARLVTPFAAGRRIPGNCAGFEQ